MRLARPGYCIIEKENNATTLNIGQILQFPTHKIVSPLTVSFRLLSLSIYQLIECWSKWIQVPFDWLMLKAKRYKTKVWLVFFCVIRLVLHSSQTGFTNFEWRTQRDRWENVQSVKRINDSPIGACDERLLCWQTRRKSPLKVLRPRSSLVSDCLASFYFTDTLLWIVQK